MNKNKNLVECWRKSILTTKSTIQDVIKNLIESSLQISLVATEDGILLGTITDGDVRRGILRGLDLDSSVTSIMNSEPLVVPLEMDKDTVFQLMSANVVNAIPVIDTKRHIVDLHLLNNFIAPKHRLNLMVIMAGGQGNRLRPHTENCPKPMLHVGGKPMLEHIIERAKKDGFRNFLLSVHYIGHMIEDYFGDGSNWGVNIKYLHENSPLGTAGAIGLLNPRPEIPFVVSNGDVLTDIRYGDLLDFHCRHEAAIATMAVREHEWEHPFGVVHTNGVDIIGFEEKPIARSHINAGIYVLEPGAIDSLGMNEYCDMPTLFNRIRNKNERTIVYPMHEPWLDVGCEVDFKLANKNHPENSSKKEMQ